MKVEMINEVFAFLMEEAFLLYYKVALRNDIHLLLFQCFAA